MKIIQQLLPATQYINEVSKKTQIVIHQTAGSYRPDYVVQGWAADPTRVGTHYVIGGLSSTNDKSWDGTIVQAVPAENWLYHLGLKGALSGNGIHDKSSIGIEICNWIQLTKASTGEFLNYVNKPVPLAQVCKLDKTYRGFDYYHAISDEQIATLKNLIPSICASHDIVLPKGKVFSAVDFEYNPERAGKEIITFHSAYRQDKNDTPPLPNLVAMLNELCA